MRRMQQSLPLLVLAAFALCVPVLKCYATTEPELTTAVRHRNIQRALTLLSEGVNVNERDEGAEQTPLMWAVQVGDLGLVESLLNHGAAVNIKDDFGNTALLIATQKRHTKIARLLMERGAKVSFHRDTQRHGSVQARRQLPQRSAREVSAHYAVVGR